MLVGKHASAVRQRDQAVLKRARRPDVDPRLGRNGHSRVHRPVVDRLGARQRRPLRQILDGRSALSLSSRKAICGIYGMRLAFRSGVLFSVQADLCQVLNSKYKFKYLKVQVQVQVLQSQVQVQVHKVQEQVQLLQSQVQVQVLQSQVQVQVRKVQVQVQVHELQSQVQVGLQVFEIGI